MEAAQTDCGALFHPKDVRYTILDWDNSSFSKCRYELVANETVSVYKELLAAEGWSNKSEFLVKDFNRIPVKVSGPSVLSI